MCAQKLAMRERRVVAGSPKTLSPANEFGYFARVRSRVRSLTHCVKMTRCERNGPCNAEP